MAEGRWQSAERALCQFGDGEDWIRELPYLVVKPDRMLPWVLPFAIPGAVLSVLWATGADSRQANAE